MKTGRGVEELHAICPKPTKRKKKVARGTVLYTEVLAKALIVQRAIGENRRHKKKLFQSRKVCIMYIQYIRGFCSPESEWPCIVRVHTYIHRRGPAVRKQQSVLVEFNIVLHTHSEIRRGRGRRIGYHIGRNDYV